jgi:hypothetical protein
MVLEVIETYLWGGVVGFAVGVIVARLYFKSKIEVKNIGQVIEYAMIHEKITELSSFSTRLNELVAEMKECSEEIEDQLEITKDIEGTLYIKEEKPEDA